MKNLIFMAILVIAIFSFSGCRSTFGTGEPTEYSPDSALSLPTSRVEYVSGEYGISSEQFRAISARYPAGTCRYLQGNKIMKDHVLPSGSHRRLNEQRKQISIECFLYQNFWGLDPNFPLPSYSHIVRVLETWPASLWHSKRGDWGLFNKEAVMAYLKDSAIKLLQGHVDDPGKLSKSQLHGVVNFLDSDYAKEILPESNRLEIRQYISAEISKAEGDGRKIIAIMATKPEYQALSQEEKDVLNFWIGNFQRYEPSKHHIFGAAIFRLAKIPGLGKQLRLLEKSTRGDFSAGLVLAKTNFLVVCPLPYVAWESKDGPFLISTLGIGIKNWEWWRTSTTTAFQADLLANWAAAFAHVSWGHSLRKVKSMRDLKWVIPHMNAQERNTLKFPAYFDWEAATPAEKEAHVRANWPLHYEAVEEESCNFRAMNLHYWGFDCPLFSFSRVIIYDEMMRKELKLFKGRYRTGTPYTEAHYGRPRP